MSEGFQTIGYAARIAFVVELAERLHAYGTTAQRLEGALILASQKLGLDCEPIANPTGMVLSRSEEHTSELQSLMRISYAVFCLKTTRAASGSADADVRN